MRVVIAPDSFGETLTAANAARAIAAGWSRSRPDDTVVSVPQSDGGPGFVEALTARPGGDLVLKHTRVRGPLDDDVEAAWAFEPDTATAYLECAQACGLALLGGPPTPRTAVAAHSGGVGQLLHAALSLGATTIVVGLGGSGCTDGGRGMIDALGGLGAAQQRLAGVRLVAATDVDHPLLGPAGAARVFGPQKGADDATVEILEQRMTAWAARLDAATGDQGGAVSARPGAGAAGGLGAALMALGATRRSGAELIADHSGLADALAGADLVVSGEGRLDDQTLHGKVVGTLAERARLDRPGGVPMLVLAGQVELDPAALRAAGITAAHSVAEFAGSVQRALDDAAAQLEGLAARTAAGLAGEPAGE